MLCRQSTGLDEDAPFLLHHVQDQLRLCVFHILHGPEPLDECVQLAGVLHANHDDRIPFTFHVIHVGDSIVLLDSPLSIEQLAFVDLHADDRENIVSETGLGQDGRVACDDAFLLELSDAVRDGAQAGVDRLGDFPERLPGVRVQESEDPHVKVLEVGRGHRVHLPWHPDARNERCSCGTIRTMSRPLSIFRSFVRFGRVRVYICSELCRGIRRARRVRPGGKDMAIGQSTPAKSKKMTVASGLKQNENEKNRWIDLQFVEVLRAPQHITISATSPRSEGFKHGVGKLDGSSIKGFKEIHESDMAMDPDPSTFAVLPWYEGEHRTARFLVDVYEGGSHERFTRDSRYMAQRAVQFAADQGYDTTYWGPEIEFFVFDGIRLLPSADAARNPWSGAGYEIISREAPWSDSGGEEFPVCVKGGHSSPPPGDRLHGYRHHACRILVDSFGMTLDAHHHEVATAGQCEIDMRYDELGPMADNVVTYRYVMKMV